MVLAPGRWFECSNIWLRIFQVRRIRQSNLTHPVYTESRSAKCSRSVSVLRILLRSHLPTRQWLLPPVQKPAPWLRLAPAEQSISSAGNLQPPAGSRQWPVAGFPAQILVLGRDSYQCASVSQPDDFIFRDDAQRLGSKFL